MEILGRILGSPARVKIMRLFLLNKSVGFLPKDIAKRSRVNPDTVRSELKLLQNVGFVKKRPKDYIFDFGFKYSREIENLLITTDTLDKEMIASNFKKAGRVKLLIVSGIFIKNKDSRVDVLIVGDKMKKGQIEEGMRKMEAEIGTELSYAVFDTKEFIYRLNMYDKLVRDILDFPHEVILQGKELSTQTLKKP
jgi:DNA-binding transcriptional ArsR family regulator